MLRKMTSLRPFLQGVNCLRWLRGAIYIKNCNKMDSVHTIYRIIAIAIFILSLHGMHSYYRSLELDYYNFDNFHFDIVGPFNVSDGLINIHTIPKSDYNRLIDLQNFTFLQNTLPCQNSSPLLMVFINSKPENFQKRFIIRNTWGKNTEYVKVVFMFGQHEDNNETNEKLNKEMFTHNDMIVGNFIDTYRNMTYKHIMALKWITYHCSEARYILKADDDIMVNMNEVIKFLVDTSPWGARKLLLCGQLVKSRVLRSYRTKWRVSPQEYKGYYYPTYCPGWALFYSQDVIRSLYLEAQKSEYFWIDDVHVTGTLANRVGIQTTNFKGFKLLRYLMEHALSYNYTMKQLPRFLLSPPNLSIEEMVKMWCIISGPNKIFNNDGTLKS